MPIRWDTDQGVTAIVVAAGLVAMMGMAALVVDGGSGFSERRQAQSGADFSVLAAVQFSDPGNLDGMCTDGNAVQRAACRGAVEAKDVVDGNLPGAGIGWAQWAGCTDPDHLGVKAQVDFGSGPTEIECVSFGSTTQEGRVQVPTFDLATNFARVIGFDTLQIAANAEAGASLPEAARILPFGIPANAGVYDCLKSRAGGIVTWGACFDGPANGNFGYLDLPTYGNPDLGTPSSNCNPSGPTLVSNMVVGVDHGLGSHATGTPSAANPALRDDKGNASATRIPVCPVFGSNANEVNVQNGNISNQMTQGMTYGNSLGRGPLWGSLPFVKGNGGQPAISLNNTPLWSFLTNTSICPGSVALPINTTQEMVDCLTGWTGADGVIFTASIATSSRYNFAPRLHGNFGSASWYLIKELQPIFLQTSYWGCSGTSCDGIHSPGTSSSGGCALPTTSNGSEPADDTCGSPIPVKKSSLVALTSFNLDRRMLPASVLASIPPDGPLLDMALTK